MDQDNRATKHGDTAPKSVVIVGVGNIGSHVTGQVGRIEDVARITLIDFDSYEENNLCCQDIAVSDLNKPKVQVQARRLTRINSAVDVRAICTPVQEVPVGLLRADAILTGLDSRATRQYVNQAAWRLGVPWIDAAVDVGNMLVRVNVYVPGQDNCCCECAWDANDYSASALEQPYPCDKPGNAIAATNAPASIGAVAAGVMAVELQKLLAGDVEHLLSGRQVMIEMRHHTHYVTRLNRNSQCRFNHQMWQIEKPAAPPSKLTFDQAVQLVTGTRRNGSGYALGMEGHSFTRMQFCPHCGNHVSGALCLADRIPTKQRVCTACGWSMVVRGFDMIEWLEAGTLSSREGRRSLSSLGFRPGDVFTVRGPHGDRHFELDGRRWAMAGSRRAKGPTTMVTE